MANFSLGTSPAEFASVYKPIEWKLSSTRSPLNVLPGETAGIVSIAAATAADVTTYGAPMREGDMIVIHGTIPPGILSAGQAVKIFGTANGLYDGKWHVRYIVSTTVTVIDCPNIGADSGGIITKLYEAYRLVAYVTPITQTTATRYELNYGTDSQFTLDVSDLCGRTMLDVFDKTDPNAGAVSVKTEGYVSQRYTVVVYEQYMVPDANGINVLEEFDKGDSVTFGGVAVNSVQPYHHIDEDDGTVDLAWEDDLEDYIMSTSSPTTTRFLTYAPRGYDGATRQPDRAVKMGERDSYYLGYLWRDADATTIRLSVESFSAAGVSLGVATQNVTAYTYSNVVAVGTRNVNSILDPSADHYSVHLETTGGVRFSQKMLFKIDLQCTNGSRRLFALNEFGAIDAYSLVGRETRETTVRRNIVFRPDMPLDLVSATRRGATQRRVYDVDILRTYTNSTRTENKQTLRWLADCFFESPDMRTNIYVNGDNDQAWTTVIVETNSIKLGGIGGRLPITYSFGVDNQKQRR